MAELKKAYVNALIELAEEKGSLDRDLEQAVLIRNALNSSEAEELSLSDIPDSEKYKRLLSLIPGGVCEDIRGTMRLMISQKQISLLVPVLEEFIDILNRRLRRVEAKVVAAKELSEQQLESIRLILTDKLQKKVDISFKVDPDIIGGFYILADGRVFDGTLRTELMKMKELLKKGSV